MKRLLVAAAALAIGTAVIIPTQAVAQVDFNFAISNAPPPMRHERIPVSRRGYEWVPGYWNWNGRHHYWSQGHWERVRPGYVYQRPEWHHGGDGWRLNRGGWTHREGRGPYGYRDRPQALAHRDRDGDGIPNRYDRRPDNPYRN